MTEKKMTCVVVSLRDGNMHVTRCLCASAGEDDSFPPEVPMSAVRASLVVKVSSGTITRLCDMWDEIRSHLTMHGGEAYVHATKVEVSVPKGTILSKPVARSASH